MFSKFWALDSSVWCVAPSMIALAGLQGGYRVMIVSVVHPFSLYASPSLANQYSLEKGRARLVCLCSNKLARNSLLELLKRVQVSLPLFAGGALPLLVAQRWGSSYLRCCLFTTQPKLFKLCRAFNPISQKMAWS